MSRLFLIAAALLAAASTPVLAQDEPGEAEAAEIRGSRIVRQNFEAISPVTTPGSEQLQLTRTHSGARLGWREDSQRTANRARTPGSRGASPVRVIRACEVNLALGDEDCAGN